MPVRTGGGDGTGGLAGGDHFAPRYLVGNALAGAPAVAQAGYFRYVPDPGDGSGIALAIAEAIIDRGDVWIGPGTYTYTGATRMIVPSYCRVRGAGAGATTIISSATDNAIFELAIGASLEHLSLTHSGTVPATSSALVVTQGPAVEISHVTFDLTLAAPGGTLTAAVLLSGNAVNRIPSKLDRLIILMPDGTGGAVAANWLAGIRGAAVASNQHIAILSDIFTDRGDVGVLTLGVEMEIEACFHQRFRRLGWFASSGRLSARGRRSVIALTRATGGELGGCQLIGSTFDLDGVQFSNATAAAIPAIYVSGGAGTAIAGIGDCEIGTGFNPQMTIGNAAEVVQDTRIHDNKIVGAAATVPIAIGAGASNTQVVANVTRGSGGTAATDLGTGSNIVLNIWGT